MADLPVQPNPTPTIDEIYQLYLDNQSDWRRDHLGASIIGRGCERELWMTFRWCTNPEHDVRMLRLFETGNREEERILNELVKLRLTVYTRDPRTGLQIHYDMFGGHFGFNMDAVAIGFEEAPKTWHNVECKTMNDKNFANVKNKGVKLAKWEHYCQMQIYMGGAKLTRAYYIYVNKNTDELKGERVHFDKEEFKRLVSKAERVIFSDGPPCRLPEKDCNRYCDHKDKCYGKELPEVSCRTCAHVTPTRDGKWICPGRELSSSDQRHPCDKHIFIPGLVPMRVIDASVANGTITYEGDIINGPGHISSFELWKWIK